MVTSLGWVTAREARGHDEDEPLVLPVLARMGVTVEVVDWDDPAVDWARYDRVVRRSAWDYPERLEEFLLWLDHAASVSDVVNPPETIRWSLDKRYLIDIAAAGLPITPTTVLLPGAPTTLPPGHFVIKPAVGAGSRDAASYGPHQHDIAEAHIARLHRDGRAVLLQPFLRSIPLEGEWPMVFFDGLFSHAASKRVTLPQADSLDALYAAETNTAHQASSEQVAVAQAVMDLVSARFGTPTYGRVDLVRDDDGRYCVLELELNEPSLFLAHTDTAAVDRFITALLR